MKQDRISTIPGYTTFTVRLKVRVDHFGSFTNTTELGEDMSTSHLLMLLLRNSLNSDSVLSFIHTNSCNFSNNYVSVF